MEEEKRSLQRTWRLSARLFRMFGLKEWSPLMGSLPSGEVDIRDGYKCVIESIIHGRGETRLKIRRDTGINWRQFTITAAIQARVGRN